MEVKYKKIIISLLIVSIIFIIDRVTKIYILNIANTQNNVDIYINPFLNFILVWNTGISFGLLSFEKSIIYNFITLLIVLINLLIIYLILKLQQ